MTFENSDIANGMLEAVNAVVTLMSVFRLYVDKRVKGVSILSYVFFTAWAVFNTFYFYPHLNQWISAVGCGVVLFANASWTVLAIRYRKN